MINIIWIVIMFVGLFYSLLKGNFEELNDIIIASPKMALKIITETSLMLVMFSGILEIAKEGGFLKFITKIIKVFIKPFYSAPRDHIVYEYISGNLACNILGLGSAATPLGLKAMEELNRINEQSKIASKDMITFIVMNTSGLTLIPTSIIALRKMYNAKIIEEIIPYIMLSTAASFLIAIILNLLFRRFTK